MVVGTEASELHLLCVLDLFGVAVAPFHGDLGVGIGVYQDVECAVAIQDGQECDRCGDLAEDSLDFVLDLFLGLLNGGSGLGILITVEGEAWLAGWSGMHNNRDLPRGCVLLVASSAG